MNKSAFSHFGISGHWGAEAEPPPLRSNIRTTQQRVCHAYVRGDARFFDALRWYFEHLDVVSLENLRILTVVKGVLHAGKLHSVAANRFAWA
jgi:hypothetical protein